MSMTRRTLVFLPTYNEAGNVGDMHARLRKTLGPDVDILFLDDNSPDGTGAILDDIAAKDPKVKVIHRSGKLGVGSAHIDGIAWAYDQGYQALITMDCDFSHSPEVMPELMARQDRYDVVTTTRFQNKDSLATWNAFRKLVTHSGHLLTRILLRMPFDATGAFRIYALDRIPREAFGLVRSRDYAFFFESLHLLHLNDFPICEVPVTLPARHYGSSKMRYRDIVKGVTFLFYHFLRVNMDRASTRLQKGGTGPR